MTTQAEFQTYARPRGNWPISRSISPQVARPPATFDCTRLLHGPLAIEPVRPDDPLRKRLEVLLGNPNITTVTQVAAAMNVSTTQLKRQCHRIFGLTPKALLMRHRMRRTLRSLENRPLCDLRLVLDPGFFDQSHFNRDFKMFFGSPPRSYLTIHRPCAG